MSESQRVSFSGIVSLMPQRFCRVWEAVVVVVVVVVGSERSAVAVGSERSLVAVGVASERSEEGVVVGTGEAAAMAAIAAKAMMII